MKETLRDPDYIQRFTIPVEAPVMIATTADIGTGRARANHPDALMDFFAEEEYLKGVKAPITLPTRF